MFLNIIFSSKHFQQMDSGDKIGAVLETAPICSGSRAG
jgi:hypothetical protein